MGTQRKSYRRYLAGEKCSINITEEKIELLNAIGFEWFLGNVWEEKYSELKTYVEENGNFRVTNNPVLARWYVLKSCIDWKDIILTSACDSETN